MGDTTRIGDRHSAIRAPRSGRLLLQRDLIFELVNTVVSDLGLQTHIFSPQLILGCRRPTLQARKKMARYVPFDIDDTSHGNYPPC